MVSYLLTFIEGLLTFVSPCILPMLPIYLLYLAGSAEGRDSTDARDKGRLVSNAAGFIIGFTVVFVLLGATVTSLGHFLSNHKELLRKLSGTVMMLFGLNFAGILKLSFLNIEKRFDFKFGRLKFLSSIVFGMVFGFGWTPCLGAFLGSALALASSSGTLLQGMTLLFLYSIGLGIPFIISAVIFSRVKDAFMQLQKHSRLISLISGILLILAGILVFTDSLKYIIF